MHEQSAPMRRAREKEIERYDEHVMFKGDELGRQLARFFEDIPHLAAYLQRGCPFDGMGCGACPEGGCDDGGFRRAVGVQQGGRQR